jgi:glycosyltransferase involved in cell wall biosynthesis
MADAFVIDSDRPGGAQRVTYDLVKEIYKKDHNHRLIYFREMTGDPMPFTRNVYIFGLSARNLLDKLERTVARVFGRFYRFLLSPLYSYQLYRQIKSDNFNTVFLVSDVAFSHFWFLKYLHPNVSIILHSKKSIQYSINKYPLSKLLFRWSVSGIPLIAISKSIAGDLALFHMPDAEVSIRYNFTDYDRIKLLATEALHPSLREGSYYLYLGRLSSEKNIEELILQFTKSVSKSVLIICGDGPENARLKEMVKTLCVNNILFLGHINNPYPIIKGAKALMLNSIREGFPTVIKEALLLDTPVISNRSFFELEDLLGPSNSRFIVDPENSISKIVSAIDSGELVFDVQSANINKYAFGGINAFL